MLPYEQANISLAREMRKNPTPWERKLWYDFLRGYPVRFQRQKPIGPFIADFYCAKAKLVIELDGSQHYEPAGQDRDASRTHALEQMGLCVLRLSNRDVDENFPGVCEWIDRQVKARL